MTDQQLVPIEAQTQIQEALALCKSVVSIVVENNDQFEYTCELTRTVRTLYKGLDGSRKFIKEPYKKKADEVDNAFREPLRSLKNLERKLSRATSDYEIAIENEQKRIADEKAKAERKRIEAEKALESTQGIDVIAKKTPPVPLPPATDYYEPPPPPPIIVGKQSLDKWTAEVTDKAEFVRYVAINGELLLVDANMKMLNKMAQDSCGEMDIPGIKCNKEKVSRYT